MKKDKPSLLAVIIGSGFGSGYSPIAPGTAGALLATLVWWIYGRFCPTDMLVNNITFGLVIVFMLSGIWATNELIPFWGRDPKRVVVDEMVGVWIPLMAVPKDDYLLMLVAFVLFRLLDIYKPLGIHWMERLRRGVGVMADDVLAGLYSLVVIIVILYMKQKGIIL